ncbi:MAG: potassium transporter TrkA [Bdellovibrionaceae bacterium]|nr:hypothetical protein [Bdellovibrionales bacterium]MCB9083245.1 potassium transporter TrkA [Pseudobdellovibrionaceae bacterium]
MALIPILSFLIVVLLSFLVIRIGSSLLSLTGLDEDTSRFQAISAFTGVGFTTTESETITKNTARRKIVILLMLAGNVGIVTMVSTLLLSFIHLSEADEKISYAMGMVIGLALLIVLMRSARINDFVIGFIARILRKWVESETMNYHKIMKLERGYAINEFVVLPDNWLANKSLAQSRVSDEGIIVLGIYRPDGTYFGAPSGEVFINGNDKIILYGKESVCLNLARRQQGTAGDQVHQILAAQTGASKE